MSTDNLKVLRSESSGNISAVLKDREHLEHRSPLSVVADIERPRMKKKRMSWSRSFSNLPRQSLPMSQSVTGSINEKDQSEDDGADERDEQDKSLSERVVFWDSSQEATQAQLLETANRVGQEVLAKAAMRGPLETRLAMTSRTAFFNDRIISPPMVRLISLSLLAAQYCQIMC